MEPGKVKWSQAKKSFIFGIRRTKFRFKSFVCLSMSPCLKGRLLNILNNVLQTLASSRLQGCTSGCLQTALEAHLWMSKHYSNKKVFMSIVVKEIQQIILKCAQRLVQSRNAKVVESFLYRSMKINEHWSDLSQHLQPLN